MDIIRIFQKIAMLLLLIIVLFKSSLAQNNYKFKQVMPRSQWMEYRPDEPHRAVILDGEGGAIVASVALGPAWLLVQKIDRFGNVLWAEPGQARKVALDTPADDENYAPIMVSDGNGGVFIAYAYCDVTYDTLIDLQYDVYVQHIARDFERLCGDRGIAVSAIDSIIGKYPHGLVTDDEGGVIVLYQGPSESYYPTMYLQRISSNGTILWNDLGKKVIEHDTLGVIRTLLMTREERFYLEIKNMLNE